jgi:Threonylcarbamoyl adenosine biosynthesis protein TsaE
MDLYRLQDHANQQYFMLNLDHVFKNCLSLIEWPERLPENLVPEERLELSIEYASKMKKDGTIDTESTKQYRILTFTPHGYLWRRRVYDIRYMGYIEDLKMKEHDEFNPNDPQN